MQVDPSTTPTRDLYQLMISLIVPRPIAWVGTRSADGVDNLAPFSFFMGVAGSPPTVAFACTSLRDGGTKDTAHNILATEVFTVSMVPMRLSEAMNATSATMDPEVSELEQVSLTPIDGVRVPCPRPGESPATLECRLVHHHVLGATHLFVGEIVWIHVADEVMADGIADIGLLDPVSRLGGISYAPVREVFEMKRP